MPEAVAKYSEKLKQIVETEGGFFTSSNGEMTLSVFSKAPAALAAALAAQRVFHLKNDLLKVCMVLHTGEACENCGDYYGPAVNHTRYILQAGNGGQVLLTEITQNLLRDSLPEGISLLDLKKHRFKDLLEPEHIFQVISPDFQDLFPSLASLSSYIYNLPVHPNQFAGREKELPEIKSSLRKARHLTLTGPAGTGKTRLAVQIASEMASEFTHGVYFISLIPARTPEMVLFTIMQALRMPQTQDAGSHIVLEKLITHLSGKKILLVLDNFEHVLEASGYIPRLVTACPDLKIMVTSRALLKVSTEEYITVPQLPLPDPKDCRALEKLARNPSVSIFVQQAQRSYPGFTLTEKNAPLITGICIKLDGLPLAIELAASNVRVFSLEKILERLDRRLDFLSNWKRDGAENHQTLRAAVEWSYNLLSQEEQKIFARLAVFVDSFSLKAVEEICATGGISPANIIDLLLSLVDKSLVLLKEAGFDPRFGMLETLREYALERLQSNPEEQELHNRLHAEYYLTFSVEAQANLRGQDQESWLNLLEKEQGNIREALNWVLNNNQAQMLLQFCDSLWLFWYLRSYLEEGNNWVAKALAIVSPENSGVLRARVLNGAGVLAFAGCDYDRALDFYKECLQLWRIEGDLAGIARVLSNMGLVASNQKDHVTARQYFRESLDLREQINDEAGVATALNNLGLACLHMGNVLEATGHFEKSMLLYRKTGDNYGLASSLLNLGRSNGMKGNHQQAIDSLLQSIEIHRDLKDLRGVADCTGELAVVSIYMKKYKLAAYLFGVEEAVRISTGFPLPEIDKVYYETNINVVRRLLGENIFNAAFEEGLKTTPEEALPAVERELVLPAETPAYPDGLTESEVKILCLLAEGYDDSEIARHLNYESRTVSNTLSRIYDKIGANQKGSNRRVRAANYARKQNLVPGTYRAG